MKKKIALLFVMVITVILALAISTSAATYYVNGNGEIQESENEETAYQYTISDTQDNLTYIYVYDANETKIIIPNMPSYTKALRPGTWQNHMGVYHISDTERATDLFAQITEIEFHENIYLDGAYSTGGLQGYAALEKISFFAKVSANSKGGFLSGCNKLNEFHFYGTELSIDSVLITSIPSANEALVVFHEGASGKLATGSETLPTVGNLGGRWTIIINENIAPSNPDDPRLGKLWGSIATTTGWQLVLAVSNKNAYTEAELEALKTSHGFASRAKDLASATTVEAVAKTYCELGLCPHDETTEYSYANGYINNGSKVIACKNGCGIESTEVLAPIFEFMGYSARTSGGSICLGYIVNKEALAFYEGVAGVSIDYGAVAIAPINEDELKPLYLDNGEVKAREYTISASVSGSYASFDFVLNGFNSEHYEVDLVMCAYVFDGSELSYLCIGEDENGSDTLIQSEIATTLKFSDYVVNE